MSTVSPRPGEEARITQRLEEQPALKPGQITQVKPKELGVRFLAGAITSVAAGLLTLLWGPKIGGIMLAFPAILAASLTLIDEEEDSAEAREDARGATAGAVGLLGFALCAWLLFGHLPAGIVLICSGASWLVLSGTLYLLLWWQRPRRQPPPG